MTEYTANFRFPLPDFTQEPWHDELIASVRGIDTAIHDALLMAGLEDWVNSTVYAIGDKAIDPQDGTIWVCGVAHTSPATPTTFATFRTANPTYWNTPTRIPSQRGGWQTATSYVMGDFVVNGGQYAVCIISHVSGTFATDVGAGKWSVLIDVSSLGVGINADPEGSIASAAITNIGGQSPTRLLVTGNTGITSFGIVTNIFKILRYGGTPLVTHNATSLILLGGANRTMRIGDIQWVVSDSSQNWHEIAFFRADGNPATTAERGVVQLATTTEANTGTDTAKAVTPAGAKAFWDGHLPAGTKVIFPQAAAPTGWTKDVVHDDKTLRIVSGAGGASGGVVPYSTILNTTAVGSHTLSLTEIPAHDHGGATDNNTQHHHHKYGSGVQGGPSGGGSLINAGNVNDTDDESQAHTHPIPSAGSGLGHVHPLDLRLQYVDCIIATRNA